MKILHGKIIQGVDRDDAGIVVANAIFGSLMNMKIKPGMPLISPLLALLHLLSAAALPIYQVQLDPEKNPERNTFLVEIGF